MFAYVLLVLCLTDQPTPPRTISVTGTATEEIAADFVDLSIRVAVTDPTAAEAQRKNQKAMATLLAWLKGFGIPSGDVATDYVSVNRYLVTNNPDTFAFEASCLTKVRLKDLKRYDAFIHELFSQGYGLLDGMTFGSTQRQERQRVARINAIRAAKEKATYLAAELEQLLDKPLTIEVLEGDGPGPMPQANMYKAMAAPGEAISQTLAPAPVVIEASVRVVFSLR